CAGVRHRYRAAVGFFSEAFAADAKLAGDLRAQHRYHAARAAALAAAGKGEDSGKLDDEERSRLRQQALAWLRADLGAYARLAARADARPTVKQRLTYWLADADLAGVRDEKALAALPEAERQPWRKLWADVAALLRQAQTE